MSYNFTVLAATKADAIPAVGTALDNLIEEKPVHAHERENILAATSAFLDAIRDAEPHEEVSVVVSGSILDMGGAEGFDTASFGITVTVQAKPKELPDHLKLPE